MRKRRNFLILYTGTIIGQSHSITAVGIEVGLITDKRAPEEAHDSSGI
jgi:hypothetical protein